MLFLSSSHIKLRWKMVKLNLKVEIINLLLARIHRKMENYFSRNLVAARWSTAPVRIFTKSPYTSLKLDYLRDFNKLFRVDGKGACFALELLLKGSVFPVVSQSTRWIISKNRTEWSRKMFTCKMGRTVAITQKTFSANFWYQQMNKRLLQLLQVSDF